MIVDNNCGSWPIYNTAQRVCSDNFRSSRPSIRHQSKIPCRQWRLYSRRIEIRSEAYSMARLRRKTFSSVYCYTTNLNYAMCKKEDSVIACIKVKTDATTRSLCTAAAGIVHHFVKLDIFRFLQNQFHLQNGRRTFGKCQSVSINQRIFSVAKIAELLRSLRDDCHISSVYICHCCIIT